MSQHETPFTLFSLPKGAKLPEDLLAACATQGLQGAVVWAIGAVADPTVAYYELSQQRYREVRLEGLWEVVSFLGNVTQKDGEPFVHAHIALSGPTGEMRGGHLVSAEVGVTLEVWAAPVTLYERHHSPHVGLSLIPPLRIT